MTHQKDTDFMSELEAATTLKPSLASNIFLLSIASLLVFAIIWSAIAEVDQLTRGQGQVMPSSDVQVVQSLEGGILSELHVREGDTVRKGDLLARIEDVLFSSEEGTIKAQLLSLRAKQTRLIAEAKGIAFKIPEDVAKAAPSIAANEKKLYDSRQKEMATSLAILQDEVKEAESNIAEVRANINKLAKGKKLLEKELEITRRLVASKAKPEIEQLQLEREYNNVSGDLNTGYKSLEAFKAKLSAAKRKVEEHSTALKSQALGELNEVEARISAIKETLTSAQDRVKRTELRAPVDGIVQNVAVKTKGGIVEPAQRLIEIIPIDNDLMIRAKVSPADVAFLAPGQKVRVNITAYDPQIYGSLWGQLERISADTVQDRDGNVFFEIDVRTDKNHLGNQKEPLNIIPGMIAETEIITGKRSVLTYLLKPILRAKSRAFTER